MNNQPLYLLQKDELQAAIQSVIAKEIQALEQRLVKSTNLLTREDAARLAGVSPNTISRWVQEGILVNRGLGRKILITEYDLISAKNGIRSKYARHLTWE